MFFDKGILLKDFIPFLVKSINEFLIKNYRRQKLHSKSLLAIGQEIRFELCMNDKLGYKTLLANWTPDYVLRLVFQHSTQDFFLAQMFTALNTLLTNV